VSGEWSIVRGNFPTRHLPFSTGIFKSGKINKLLVQNHTFPYEVIR
jgi:hypothetical protein